MAMDIISKDKKEIQWKGLLRTTLNDVEELKAERIALQNKIEEKAAYLQELEEQISRRHNIQVWRMLSHTEDDEKSLLRDIKHSVFPYDPFTTSRSHDFYLKASYILNNVTAFRLDSPQKVRIDQVSDERVADGYINFLHYDFDDIQDYFIKELERASSSEMDVHTLALSMLERLNWSFDTIQLGLLATFGVIHGAWLLAVKVVCSESSEEDSRMALKQVEGLFMSLGQTQGKEVANNYRDFYIYISLLSSTVTTKPIDNWKSMGSHYTLIEIMFKVSSLVHFFLKDARGEFIPQSLRDEFVDLFYLCLYWITRGVITCSFHCNQLPKNRYVIQDSQMLMHIHGKLISIYERLQKINSDGMLYKNDETILEKYQIPKSYGRCYYALMALFDLPPEDLRLFCCERKDTVVSAAAAFKKRKILLLLISKFDISFNEINFLKDTYVEAKKSVQQEFELIWLPIHFGPWTASLEGQYTKLLQSMPWFTVEHPSSINDRTKDFIKDVWKFHTKPIIVVLNEDGRVICPNAVHLMHIWGSKAFPFTRLKERTMWSVKMRLDSLVLSFDPNIANMIEAGKWIILYGGNDFEWILKFTDQVREVSSDSGVPIEMVYVGRNTEIMSLISKNLPRSYSPSPNKIWYFWTRLESILVSKYQTFPDASDDAMDLITQKVKKLLSYASVESWAGLSIPSSDLIVHGLGDTMLKGFIEYKEWKQHIHTKEFAVFFQNHIKELEIQESDNACSRITLHIDNKDAVESLKCPDCSHFMEKKIQYRCCHKHEELE